MKMQSIPLQLSTMPFVAGKIGRLLCLNQFWALAGDRISLNAMINVRSSPLRRYLSLEPSVQFFAFCQPARHIYGDNWTKFLADGVDEQETLDSLSIPNFVGCLGANYEVGTYPLHTFAPYSRIYNRFFRVPSDTSKARGFGILPDKYFEDDDIPQDTLRFGHPCAQLQQYWNTGLNADTVTDDDSDVPVSGGKFDLRDLRTQQSRYSSEQQQAFFNNPGFERYTDTLKQKFGTSANVDADQRPTLLAMTDNAAGGVDVNGTDASSLGTFSGKQSNSYNFGFPRRHFAEHSIITVLALVRFPPLYTAETSPLFTRANPSYNEISGDARFLAGLPPVDVDINDYFSGQIADVPDLGKIPSGNEFRNVPVGFASPSYNEVDGFPFLNDPVSWKDVHYVDSADYDRIYHTTQQGHYQMLCNLGYDVKRNIPAAVTSIFAGGK